MVRVTVESELHSAIDVYFPTIKATTNVSFLTDKAVTDVSWDLLTITKACAPAIYFIKAKAVDVSFGFQQNEAH